MNFWFPCAPRLRRGRSDVQYSFPSESVGTPIRNDFPSVFQSDLIGQHRVAIYLEDHDPVYRGEVCPKDPLAAIVPGNPIIHGQREVESESDDSSDDSEESSDSDFSSVHARASSPPERLSSPRTPATYSRHDQERADELRRLRAQREAAPARPRRSARLIANPDHDFSTAAELQADGYRLHPVDYDERPRPWVDSLNYVMAVVAGGPKGQAAWWKDVLKNATQDIRRLQRNGEFPALGQQESHVRFGMGYGEEYPVPHQIANNAANSLEISLIQKSEAFQVMSAYQNHLYAQYAPAGYAIVAAKVGEVVNRDVARPAFPNSVFTTSKISLGNGPSRSLKDCAVAYETMEAITVLGDYDHKARGQMMSWEDSAMVEVPPGSTLLIPAGTKPFSFLPVAPHETRYLFRQTCHSGVLRWVEKGGRSDGEWEDFLSAEEMEAWKAERARLAPTRLNSFARLCDIYVL